MSSKKTPLSKDALFGLIAMALGIFLVANDFTAFPVAIPAMEKEFSADVTTGQWVINAHALVFGVLVISGGRLADIYGRRRIFFIGSAIFSFFSLLGGLADSMATLLVSRALMGVGGALMWPSLLGLIYNLMPDDRAGLAGGLVMVVCSVGNSVGPMLGGTLTDGLGWRYIFLINLPIALLSVIVSWKVVPADLPENADERLDYTGVGMLSAGLFALLLALDLVVDLGFENSTIIALLAGFVIAMAIFAFIESRAGRDALIPEDVAKNRGFLAAGLATLLMSAIFFAALLYLPQFFSKVLGFSTMHSGMGLLPMMVVFGISSFAAGHLYELLGAKLIVSLGAIFLAGGMFLLADLDNSITFRQMIPGMMVLGVGVGLFYSTITTAAITAVNPSRASLAGAILYMFQVAGGSIGLGMNTAIVATASSLPAGINQAFIVNAVLALVGLLVCIAFVGNKASSANSSES